MPHAPRKGIHRHDKRRARNKHWQGLRQDLLWCRLRDSARKFDQDVTDKENRDKLWSFVFQIDEFKDRVAHLRAQPRGGNWVHRMTRPLVEPGRSVPAPIVRQIGGMVRTRSPVLTIDREASEAEVLRLEEQQGRRLPRPQYVEEPVAQIEGLEALYPENDLRALLVLQIEEELKVFERQRIDELSSSQLTRWSKWLGSTDPALERASAAIRAGRQLLQPENLAPLSRLLLEPDQRAQFKRYLKEVASEPQ